MIHTSGMFMMHKFQWDSGPIPFCTTATYEQKCRSMNCLRSCPALFATVGQPGTGNFTVFNNQGNGTAYMTGSPSPYSTTIFWGKLTPCCCSMCFFKEEFTTITSHSDQLTLFHILSLNTTPSPVIRRLYAPSLHFSQTKQRVQTINLVFYRLVSSPTLLIITSIPINAS